jgi:hypothetical protein
MDSPAEHGAALLQISPQDGFPASDLSRSESQINFGGTMVSTCFNRTFSRQSSFVY